jgi:hypothetical protein
VESAGDAEERSLMIVSAQLERFSNSRALNDSKESGFFLRKKPLSSRAFGVQQLENRYKPSPMQPTNSLGDNLSIGANG